MELRRREHQLALSSQSLQKLVTVIFPDSVKILLHQKHKLYRMTKLERHTDQLPNLRFCSRSSKIHKILTTLISDLEIRAQMNDMSYPIW